jgi:type III pantothenate kinase
MRRLAIDVGNTNVTVGLFVDGELSATWRFSSDRRRTADEWWALFAAVGAVGEDPQAAVIGSVVPVITGEIERALSAHGRPPLVVRASDLPVRLAVNRDEVGADRIANAVGVARRHRLPAVVVDLGTATTIDVVAADGTYLGGAIAPGILTALQALLERAARLSQVEMYVPESVIGRTSADCLRAGVLFGTAGQIDRLVEMAAAELGAAPFVVATGGLAEWVMPVARTITVLDPDLTLWGLYHCWELAGGAGEA